MTIPVVRRVWNLPTGNLMSHLTMTPQQEMVLKPQGKEMVTLTMVRVSRRLVVTAVQFLRMRRKTLN